MGRLAPVSKVFGLERGLPVDRYFSENFLSEYLNTRTGHVLEIGHDRNIKHFATDVDYFYILKIQGRRTNEYVTGGLDQNTIPSEAKIDCIICLKAIKVIYDFRKALCGYHYVLEENGTLLTVSQVSVYGMEKYGDFYRFSTRATESL